MQEDVAELIQEMREVGKDNTRVKEQNLLEGKNTLLRAAQKRMNK